ncbi:MAG TPA: PAS and ANTAR domain-containing protein [Mycobacterium sp.]|nr:PAS and ANTAR domain-containing protein [Mycobacterium sp.]
MIQNFDAQFGRPAVDPAAVADPAQSPLFDVLKPDELRAVDEVIGPGEPQRIGRFRFFIEEQRWEWSDAVARMHGYEPEAVVPTTELLLQHKHPEDRPRVAAVLSRVLRGEPFCSRHRIIDAAGRTHWIVVVGDIMCDAVGAVIGTAGFYVDVTESLLSDISTVLNDVAASRAQIEQAKGVLMAVYGISAERAFEILVWRSQETNVKVRDLAARFLAAISGRVSSDTLNNVDHALLTLE